MKRLFGPRGGADRKANFAAQIDTDGVIVHE
jgi:hypothetical protein